MKKVLLIYPSMILGGSTTSLLAFINNLDKTKYQIDLQLQSNSGPLFNEIPDYVNVLPPAQKYSNKTGKIIRKLRFILQGAALKALYINIKNNKRGMSSDVITDFFAKSLSKKNKNHYDYAIGFLEGWSDVYLAYKVNADKKYAWLHSTFANITDDPKSQLHWMKKVDKIVFVTDACKDAFKKELPEMSDKAITVENITDSSIIKKRSEDVDINDKDYLRFTNSDAFKIITVCRININTKGLDRIVSCAKRLKEQGKDFLWYIVGDGADEARLGDMINNADVSDCLVHIGVRYNPYPFIKAADIMCMPSRYEGKPMVITESMILGTPPVVTEYLSARDQIEDTVDGIVVENCDDTITKAVLECIHNGDMLEKMKAYLSNHGYGNTQYMFEIENKLF